VFPRVETLLAAVQWALTILSRHKCGHCAAHLDRQADRPILPAFWDIARLFWDMFGARGLFSVVPIAAVNI
jgi:hypothetical protein